MPSRNALEEFKEWIKQKTILVENLSSQMSIEIDNLVQLDVYKAQLVEINEEIKHDRECSLNFIKNSIENEIKQGFYDLGVSEQLTEVEREWNRLKQKISNDIERIDINLIKLNEFERNIKQMKEWTRSQTQNELKNLPHTSKLDDSKNLTMLDEINCVNSIEDDKATMKKISAYIEQLKNFENSWKKDGRKTPDHLDSVDSVINLISQHHINAKLEELKQSLNKIELITKLKIESNLSQLKQTYAAKMNDLNSELESQLSFISHGKILSRQQYEKTIGSIKDVQQKLAETRTQMQSTLIKFESDLKSIDFKETSKENGQINNVLDMVKNKIGAYDINGLLDNNNLKKSNLLTNSCNKKLEKTAQQLVTQAETEILSVWEKYDDIHQNLQTRINETRRNILNDMDHIDQIIFNSTPESNLFQQTLNDMLENKSIFEKFTQMSEYLTDKFAHNESVKQQLEANKLSLQESFRNLSDLAESLRIRLDELSKEHQAYLNLVERTCALMTHANQVIQTSNAISSADTQASFDIKANTVDLEECENSLRDLMGQFKDLNVKDTEKINKIYEITNPCSALLTSLRETRLNLLDFVQERSYVIQIKLNDIETYLSTFLNRLRGEFRVEAVFGEKLRELNVNDFACLCIDELAKLINAFKYMISNDSELNKCELLLKELELQANDADQTSKIEFFKEELRKIRNKIELISAHDKFFDNLMKLKESNENLSSNYLVLNKMCDESNKSKVDHMKLLKENFINIRLNLEKQLVELESHGFDYFDVDTLRNFYLSPIERFFNKLVGEMDSLFVLTNTYTNIAIKIDMSLSEIESRLVNFKNHSLNEKLMVKNNGVECEKLEQKLSFLKELKSCLCGAQLKADMDALYELASKINLNDKRMQLECPNHDAIRIRYLNLTCRVDKEMKKLECDFTDFKAITQKSQKLLDLIKHSHKLLAGITLSSKSSKKEATCKTRSRSYPHKSSRLEFPKSEVFFADDYSPRVHEERAKDLLIDLTMDSLSNKIEFKNDKTVVQLIEVLKFGILSRLQEHEHLKDELYHLSRKAHDKSNVVKFIVDKIMVEWELIKEKVQYKLLKLEKFKNKLNELDMKLNRVREHILTWETYLDQECFAQLDVTNYQQILSKKMELEHLLESLNKKEIETQHLFKVCLYANNANLNGNRLNQAFVLNLRERWNNLRNIIKDKIYLIENVWLLLCDLTDQTENFYLILNKTENFYRNTLLTANNNPNVVLKLIQELYCTIQEDYKLIQYINKSYVSFFKMINNFELFRRLEKFKYQLLELNARWDSLHNEIAIKIKLVRLKTKKKQKKIFL